MGSLTLYLVIRLNRKAPDRLFDRQTRHLRLFAQYFGEFHDYVLGAVLGAG